MPASGPDESLGRDHDGHQARRPDRGAPARAPAQERPRTSTSSSTRPARSSSSSRTSNASRATSATRSSSPSATARTPTAGCSTASGRSTGRRRAAPQRRDHPGEEPDDPCVLVLARRTWTPNRSTPEVRAAAAYLQYAESGGQNLGDVAQDKPQLNPFEVDVRDTLDARRHPARARSTGPPATGSTSPPSTRPSPAGWSSPSSATAPPTTPRRPPATVTGSARNSSRRLGWSFHRIWSTDWFTNKERETEKVLAAYQAAVIEADHPNEQGDGAAPWVPATSSAEAPRSVRTQAFRSRRRDARARSSTGGLSQPAHHRLQPGAASRDRPLD